MTLTPRELAIHRLHVHLSAEVNWAMQELPRRHAIDHRFPIEVRPIYRASPINGLPDFLHMPYAGEDAITIGAAMVVVESRSHQEYRFNIDLHHRFAPNTVEVTYSWCSMVFDADTKRITTTVSTNFAPRIRTYQITPGILVKVADLPKGAR